MSYQRSVLSNGITVVTESMSAVRSVTLGLWFGVGSRHELEGEYGLSHLLEHMMFKGTPTRTTQDISQAFDFMGAQFNAFTSKEHTCYYARFVDEYLADAFEILADMVTNSLFADEELKTEREVVLEEMSRCKDDPSDYVFEIFDRNMWPHHPLGRPILVRVRWLVMPRMSFVMGITKSTITPAILSLRLPATSIMRHSLPSLNACLPICL